MIDGPQSTPSEPPRILCLDIEGGHGGSSRSLYESIRHMDRTAIAIEVWCRRKGPMQARYEALGISCRVQTGMPKVSSLPRFTRNVYHHLLFWRDFARNRRFRRDLVETIEQRFDLVHFNHEGLYMLAWWLRLHTRAPFTMHVRTQVADTIFARFQMWAVTRSIDRIAFVTAQEQKHFRHLGGRVPGTVIHNIATFPDSPPAADERVPMDSRLRIASLSNYMWLRGTDRLIDIAVELKARGRRDILFVVCGDTHLTRSMPGELGRLAHSGGTLEDYATQHHVDDMFVFLGHVVEPERVLTACHALAKLTRENNPWGRDILEAMAAGLPVLAVGMANQFVEDGVTGILQTSYDFEAMVTAIIRLADQRDNRRMMGAAARNRVEQLCDGPTCASALLDLWRETVGNREGRAAQ